MQAIELQVIYIMPQSITEYREISPPPTCLDLPQ